MTDDDEIVEVDEEKPRDEDLARCAALAEDLLAAEAEVDRATRALRDALNYYRGIAERDLPEAMAAVRHDDFTLTGHGKVRIDRRYVAGKLTDRDGLAWVAANGGEELIRSTIRVELPVAERAVAYELLAQLRRHPASNRFVKLVIEEGIHSSTIASFAKEAVRRGLNPPLERLGVARRVVARFVNRKLTPVELKGFERI
jgi:hypothetical protein